jgi:hypothetical protein
MLKIDRLRNVVTSVGRQKLADAGIIERNLQALIRQSPGAFFQEMGERLLLIGEEVKPSTIVADRIDLLALDDEGRAVVIELKRGNERLQLLQALYYAAMLSHWNLEQLLEERGRLTNRTASEAEVDLRDHIGPDLSSVNQVQRVILIAEEFDWEVLCTAEWMNERYDLDIRCFRIALSSDASSEYLSCTCIYPPPELADHVRSRTMPSAQRPRTWDEILANVTNPAEVAFFRRELARGIENRPTAPDVAYRDGAGRRRYWVSAYKKRAYVAQGGRFPDDLKFWRDTLGADCDPKPIFEGATLRFYLTTPKQFEIFEKFIGETLPTLEFVIEPPDEVTGAPADKS